MHMHFRSLGGGGGGPHAFFSTMIPLHECILNLAKWPQGDVKNFFALHQFAVVKLGYQWAWRHFFCSSPIRSCEICEHGDLFLLFT